MVHFVGAGPGAPDLITVRGAKLLADAQVVIYAGSLVNPKLLEETRADCPCYDSSRMTLEEIIGVMKTAEAEGKPVVRLHTGEPSLYGAIREQMRELDALGIAYDSTPGVTAAFGAAASLDLEYTIPEVAQSLILTRLVGRTAVPEKEEIRRFASHQSSMAVYLSAGAAIRLAKELQEGGYAPDTPTAVVYRATWEDERVLFSTVDGFARQMQKERITRHAVILVGTAIGYTRGWREWRKAQHIEEKPKEAGSPETVSSKLYSASFSTGYRTAATQRLAILSFSAEGDQMAAQAAKRLEDAFSEIMLFPAKERAAGVSEIVGQAFSDRVPLFFIGAMGICVRLIAPYCRDKLTDIPVVVMDERALHVIPVLSGHVGGANRLACLLAERLGADAVITTATDVQGVFAVDTFAVREGLLIRNKRAARRISARLLAGGTVSLAVQEDRCIVGEKGLPDGVTLLPWSVYQKRQQEDRLAADICITDAPPGKVRLTVDRIAGDTEADAPSEVSIPTESRMDTEETLYLVPKQVILGMGCQKGVSVGELETFARQVLAQAGRCMEEVLAVASIDKKAKEPGLVELCRRNRLPFAVYPPADLEAVAGDFTESVFVKETVGVGNVCERAAVRCALEWGDQYRMLVKKTTGHGMTAAVCSCERRIFARFSDSI